MHRYICLLVLIACWMSGVAGAAPDIRKQDLKILYVGNRPDMPLPDYYTVQLGAESFADYKGRMAAFESMLKEYFTTVKIVDGRDYTEQMSAEYDVTIFDALPKPIVPPVVEKDSVFGFTKNIQRGKFLSDGFDWPVVFISHMADEMGCSLGLKLNWYCLCLFYHALNIRMEHPVFHGPFDVQLTLEKRPTPEDFYLYSQDWVLPREIPMWRVSSDSSRIGMVSGWYGVEEGKDAEIISGGHCMKAYENMAIGRHGDFLLWGFGAAPDLMTPEAQTVFANAVCYISRFAGQKPVVRKVKGVTLRGEIQEFLKVVSPEGYQTYLKGVDTYNEWLKAKQEELSQVFGRDLTQAERGWLKHKVMEPWSHLEYVKKNSRYGLIYDYNMDIEAVRKFLSENMEYFYSTPGLRKEFILDEDVKSLGISNREVWLLDTCVNILESKREPEKALRILKRYTNQGFNTALEWRMWLDKNRNQLFFTESEGYKFIGDGSEGRNNKDTFSEQHERPVKITMEMQGTGSEREIRVLLNIKGGYHVYASGDENCPFILTKVSFTYPSGVTGEEEAQLPVSESYAGEDDVRIYRGNVVFVQKIKVNDVKSAKGEIQCEVEYQCCDKDMCLPPEKEIHRIKL